MEPGNAVRAAHAADVMGLRPLSERDPDAELVARVGAQDPAAVRMLVSRKLPRLLALATRMLGDRMEAEDVAQEAFVRIWKQAPHWGEGEARFDTWIHRVALNLCYDRLRGRLWWQGAAFAGIGLAGGLTGAFAVSFFVLTGCARAVMKCWACWPRRNSIAPH